VRGQAIEEIARYKERGWDVINAGALDRPTKCYDVLAATWTQLSLKRLKSVGCRAVVVKDNDEPFNVIQQATIDGLNVKVQLIDDWGISTRVAWNLAQITRYAPELRSLLIIANTPSHDAINAVFTGNDSHNLAVQCDYGLKNRTRLDYDVVIVHLAKKDFEQKWFDDFLRAKLCRQLLISTTRGALFSAKALNVAVMNHAPETVVLDWAWEQEKLDSQLIADKRIVLTNHTSYRSADSKRELTDVTIAAVDKLIAAL
jgi:hypothetical protein